MALDVIFFEFRNKLRIIDSGVDFFLKALSGELFNIAAN